MPTLTMRRMGLAGGLAGTDETIRQMARIVFEHHAAPETIKAARAMVADAPAADGYAEAKAIWSWIKRNVRYTRDPRFMEHLQSPRVTLAERHGDCDDVTILFCALALAVNAGPCRIVTMSQDDFGPSHVYPEIYVKGRWVTADVCPPSPAFGWTPPSRRRWLYELPDGNRLGCVGAAPRRVVRTTGAARAALLARYGVRRRKLGANVQLPIVIPPLPAPTPEPTPTPPPWSMWDTPRPLDVSPTKPPQIPPAPPTGQGAESSAWGSWAGGTTSFWNRYAAADAAHTSFQKPVDDYFSKHGGQPPITSGGASPAPTPPADTLAQREAERARAAQEQARRAAEQRNTPWHKAAAAALKSRDWRIWHSAHGEFLKQFFAGALTEAQHAEIERLNKQVLAVSKRVTRADEQRAAAQARKDARLAAKETKQGAALEASRKIRGFDQAHGHPIEPGQANYRQAMEARVKKMLGDLSPEKSKKENDYLFGRWNKNAGEWDKERLRYDAVNGLQYRHNPDAKWETTRLQTEWDKRALVETPDKAQTLFAVHRGFLAIDYIISVTKKAKFSLRAMGPTWPEGSYNEAEFAKNAAVAEEFLEFAKSHPNNFLAGMAYTDVVLPNGQPISPERTGAILEDRFKNTSPTGRGIIAGAIGSMLESLAAKMIGKDAALKQAGITPDFAKGIGKPIETLLLTTFAQKGTNYVMEARPKIEAMIKARFRQTPGPIEVAEIAMMAFNVLEVLTADETNFRLAGEAFRAVEAIKAMNPSEFVLPPLNPTAQNTIKPTAPLEQPSGKYTQVPIVYVDWEKFNPDAPFAYRGRLIMPLEIPDGASPAKLERMRENILWAGGFPDATPPANLGWAQPIAQGRERAAKAKAKKPQKQATAKERMAKRQARLEQAKANKAKKVAPAAADKQAERAAKQQAAIQKRAAARVAQREAAQRKRALRKA